MELVTLPALDGGEAKVDVPGDIDPYDMDPAPGARGFLDMVDIGRFTTVKPRTSIRAAQPFYVSSVPWSFQTN